MADAKKDKLQIRNSTVDFLVFTKDAHEDGIEVRVQDHDVWLTQKAIAQLFDVDRSVVTKHLKNVYESGELSEDATCANFAQVADNGKTYHYKFYSLSAIIAVGYRINSGRATHRRKRGPAVALKILPRSGRQHAVVLAAEQDPVALLGDTDRKNMILTVVDVVEHGLCRTQRDLMLRRNAAEQDTDT